MKKILVLLIVILAVGCSKKEVILEEQKQEKDLLTEINKIVEIYKIKTEKAISFTTNSSGPVGNNYYSVFYVTDATKEEISDHYQSILTTIENKNEPYFDNMYFTGTMDERKMSINIFELEDGVNVSLYIEEKNEVKDNEYFSNQIKTKFDLIESSKATDKTYEENFELDVNLYRIILKDVKTKEEVLSYYEEKYSGEKDYNKTVTDTRTTLTWSKDNYLMEFYYDEVEYLFSAFVIREIVQN